MIFSSFITQRYKRNTNERNILCCVCSKKSFLREAHKFDKSKQVFCKGRTFSGNKYLSIFPTAKSHNIKSLGTQNIFLNDNFFNRQRKKTTLFEVEV